MSFDRLTIEVLDNVGGLPATFKVPFNPTEFTLDKKAQIGEIAIPGIDSPILQFIRGENERLTLDLFFDITLPPEDAGATGETINADPQMIYKLVKIQPETHAPPRIRVVWGKALAFKAIVESVQQKFTLFSPQGAPLRAMLTVTFREYKTLEEQLQELNLQSADHTKQRVVQRGDTLSRIAAEEYDDPRAWREIAAANNIDNPRRLVPGTVLRIPPLDVFSTETVNAQ
ncbi:MAG: LysM peptidoglycan-binding domain-containing protein [Chloroflexales bacterium]|nr:LysM peptidoglycan-binding domain-containing protein [Chloroflexales bacterium]